MVNVRLVALGLLFGGCSSTPPVQVSFANDCTPIDSWTVPATAIGQTSSAQLLAVAVTAGNLDLAITGPAAAEFVAVLDRSTCNDLGELGKGESCSVFLEFTPIGEGAHEAALSIGDTVLPLHGEAIAAPAGLVANVRNASSMHGLYTTESRTAADQTDEHHSRYIISVRNAGTQTITPGTGEITGSGFTIEGSTTCTLPLAPGNACEITIATSQFAPGCAAGHYRLPSSANTIDIPITNTFVGGVQVSTDGAGQGRIVSSPPGIDCPGQCSAAFSEPVTLTATPSSGHHFVGWTDPECGDAATCTLEPTTKDDHGRTDAHRLTVTFATPRAHKVDVQFAGDGSGFVGFSNQMPSSASLSPPAPIGLSCTASCTRWFEPGMPVFAAAGTASRFDGFAGCGLGRSCGLDLTKDAELTATFSRAPDEQITLYPKVPATAGSFASDGDLVVGGTVVSNLGALGDAVVSRLSPTGALRWSYAVPDHRSVCNVKAAPTGDIYAIATTADGGATLVAFSADGQLRWKQELGANTRSCTLSFTSSGDIVTNGVSAASETLIKVSPGGAVLWSIPTAGDFLVARDRAVVINAAGTIAQVEHPQAGSAVIGRYSANGTPLAAWPLPLTVPISSLPQWANVIATAQGGVIAQLMIDRTRWTVGLDATGAVLFTRTDPLQATGFALDIESDPSLGMSVRSDGELFLWFAHAASWDFGEGYHVNATLQRLTGTGTQTWTTEIVAAQPAKPGRGGGLPMDAQLITSSACDGAGHCALFGTYVGVGGGPWIQIFKP